MRTCTRSNVLVFTTLVLSLVVACGGGQTPAGGSATTPAAPEPPSASNATAAAGADAGAAGPGAPAATADAGGGKAAECTHLANDAHSEMDAEIIKVDTGCKKDADCMVVKGHACDFTCVTAAIPKAEEKEWTRELGVMKSGPCKKWAELDCAKEGDGKAPTCSDDSKKAACKAGHCVLK
jgi:hypothetical protein